MNPLPPIGSIVNLGPTAEVDAAIANYVDQQSLKPKANPEHYLSTSPRLEIVTRIVAALIASGKHDVALPQAVTLANLYADEIIKQQLAWHEKNVHPTAYYAPLACS